MSRSTQVGSGSPINVETISSIAPVRPDFSGAGSVFGTLMSELEQSHHVSIHQSSSLLSQGIGDLSKQVSAEIEQMQAPMQLDGSVASAMEDGAKRQLGLLRVQTAMALTQTAANGTKKALTDILNQK